MMVVDQFLFCLGVLFITASVILLALWIDKIRKGCIKLSEKIQELEEKIKKEL